MSDEMPCTQQQMPDGSWVDAVPLGWQGSGIDFELIRKGRRWVWDGWDEDVCVASGQSRTHLGALLAILRARRRLRRS